MPRSRRSTSASARRCWSIRRRSARCWASCARRDTRSWRAFTASTTTPRSRASGVVYELLDMGRVDRITVKLRVPSDAPRVPIRSTRRLADRRSPGARGLRHVRRRLRRAPGPAPDPDARGLRGASAASRLPDRRRTGDLHARRGQMAGVAPSEPARAPDAVGLPPARAEHHALAAGASSVERADGVGHDAGAVDAQLRPAPPGDARRAAAARDAAGRDRPRHQADRRLRAHGDREDGRGQGVLEGHPDRRADGLPVLLLQRDGLLRRRRDSCSRSRCRRAGSTCA